MAAHNPGRPRQVTYDYTRNKLNVRRPYIRAENRFLKALIETCLEAGLSHSEAVKLAIGVYKEVDVLARNEKSDMLSATAVRDIRNYCRGIIRSGTTFSSFEIATRAVAAWRLTDVELVKLHQEWERESVTKRLRERKIRQEAAAKRHGTGSDVENLYQEFDQLCELDAQVGQLGDP